MKQNKIKVKNNQLKDLDEVNLCNLAILAWRYDTKISAETYINAIDKLIYLVKQEVLKEKKAELLKEIDKIKISHQWDERIKIVFLEDLKKKVEDVFADTLTPKRGIMK